MRKNNCNGNLKKKNQRVFAVLCLGSVPNDTKNLKFVSISPPTFFFFFFLRDTATAFLSCVKFNILEKNEEAAEEKQRTVE